MSDLFAIVADGRLVAGECELSPVPWWSFTKTILAAAAHALVRDGRLRLHDLVKGKPYTLRQLLRHTAGLANYTDLGDYQPAVEVTGSPWTAEKMLRRVDADRPPFDPGTMWKYSNLGYFYIRRLIEETTGDDIGRTLDDLVLRPLDIDGVSLAPRPEDMERTA